MARPMARPMTTRQAVKKALLELGFDEKRIDKSFAESDIINPGGGLMADLPLPTGTERAFMDKVKRKALNPDLERARKTEDRLRIAQQ
jgi:hypothetical protein